MQRGATGFSLADRQEFVADGWPPSLEAPDLVFGAQAFASGHQNMTA